jgi:VCBS repeat-containing protein
VLPNRNFSPSQTFDISITAVNDAPTFVTDGDQTVLEDAGATTVLGFATGNPGPTTATDESSQTLTYVIDGNTNPGLFSAGPAISAAGDLTYTPVANASGTATITVHVVDSGPNGGNDVNFSPTQTFDIIVTAVNDPPVAVADGPYLVKQGTSINVGVVGGVLTNDTDVDSPHSSLVAVVDVLPAHGTVTLNSDGSFAYAPTGVYLGADSFTYHANDGSDNSNIATVSINVYLNHAPTAVGDVVTVVSGSGYVALNLLANDNAVNPDPGEVLRITSATHPVHGTVVITGGGTGLSYRPATGFIGNDVFNYTISDGVFSSTASVLVHVPKDLYKPVSTAPVQTISGQSIGSNTFIVHLAWTGTDRGYGIKSFELWQSVNGHSYTKIKTTSGHSASVTTKVGSTYRFRVRATDKVGNVGSYAYGPTFRVNLYQESSASYSSPWIYLSGTAYSGGHARTTTTAGLSASFTSIGRTFSWVSSRGPTRGTADVYIDGVLVRHITLTTSLNTYRYVAYSVTFASSALHTVKIVYTGGLTKRIDLDAFIVLR